MRIDGQFERRGRPPTVAVSVTQGDDAMVIASSANTIAAAAQCPDGRTVAPGNIVVDEFPVRLRVTASDDDDVASVQTRLINANIMDVNHVSTIQSHVNYEGTEYAFLTVGARKGHPEKFVAFDAAPLGGDNGTFLIDAMSRDFAGNQVSTATPVVGTLGSFCQ